MNRATILNQNMIANYSSTGWPKKTGTLRFIHLNFLKY